MNNVPKEANIPIFKSITIPTSDKDKEPDQYPIFNRYPSGIINFMQQRYDRKITAQINDKEHDELLKTLQEESKEIASKQAHFTQQQQS